MKLLGHWFDGAVCKHRVHLPLHYLTADFPQHTFKLSSTAYPDDFDWFYLNGRLTSDALPQIAAQKARGTKFVWGLDDDYERVPKWNRHRPQTEYEQNLYYLARDCADLILVSTPHLAEVVNRPAKTVVAPNLTNLNDFHATATPAPVVPGEPLRVLWSGSDTHVKDCELLVAGVKHCLQKFGDGVQFFFLGYCPDELLRDCLGKGVNYNEWIDLGLYAPTLVRVRPHVCLAPMVDDQFNRSKSNIRLQEAAALTAAVIASPNGEYQCIAEGETGVYAGSDAEWIAKLEHLLTDHSHREHLAINGRWHAEIEWDWNRYECRQPWREWVERLDEMVGN